jgi:hypothetical protein
MKVVLQDEETFNAQELSDLRSALYGTEYRKLSSKNVVTDLPEGFKEWMAENSTNQANWRSAPYFVRDNFINGTIADGLKPAIIKPPKPVKTEEQKADIQARWNTRVASRQYDETLKNTESKYGKDSKAIANLVDKIRGEIGKGAPPDTVKSMIDRLNHKTQVLEAWNERAKPVVVKEYKFNKTELKKRGFEIDDNNVNKKVFDDVIKGFNLNEFDDEMNEVAKNRNITWKEKSINADDNCININFESSNGVLLQRRYQKGVVSHELFYIPEDMQGQGFSKEVFRVLYKQYKNAGIETVKVHANINVGGYTWAKYGFIANKDEYKHLLYWADKQRNKGEINADQYKDFEKWLKGYENKDIPIYEVAYGKEYGKNLLMKSDWYGYINFFDTKTKKIFEDYLAKG